MVVAVVCVCSRHFQLDDALIYARYIRNALNGYGLVYNVGERVNALTSPLFSMLLLGLSWLLHGRIMLAELVLSGITLAAACMAAERLVPWSGLLIACTGYFYLCIGMETFLFLFMLTLMTLLFVEDKVEWLPAIAMLTMLTRFEGAALVAVIGTQVLKARKRPSAWSYLPAAAILLGYLTFNHIAYGHLLPASASAKFDQGFSGYWGTWPRAFLRRSSILAMSFAPSFWVVPCGLVLAFLGIRKEGWSRMNRALVPFGFILLAFYVLFNIPGYHWYYAPFFFFIGVYALRGLPQTRTAHVCLVITMSWCLAVTLYRQNRSGAPPAYIAMGQWLNQNTKTDARIAAIEIGTLGWYSERYTDDLIGLTNPANAQYLRHRDLYSWLNEQRPDYVVMHRKPLFGEIAAAKSQDYEYLPVHFGDIFLMKRKNSNR